MKKRVSDLTDGEIKATLDALYTAAGTVKGRGAMRVFLKNLLTVSEKIMLGRRIIIGRMLLKGVSYEEIGKSLRVSPVTIDRVQKWLKGLEQPIKRMEIEYQNRASNKIGSKSTLSRLKRKYPLHFLLIPERK